MTREETMEKIITILRKTDDGNRLSKLALKTVESAVNNHLNEYGLNLLDRLYQMVMDGSYSAAKFKQAINDTRPTK